MHNYKRVAEKIIKYVELNEKARPDWAQAAVIARQWLDLINENNNDKSMALKIEEQCNLLICDGTVIDELRIFIKIWARERSNLGDR